MDSNHAVQLKPLYSQPQISLYNSPVISATIPNLSLTSGLHLVNASTNDDANTTGHDTNSIGTLTTLQASSANPTLTISGTSQLLPMTALNSVQFQQVHQQGFIEQANIRQVCQNQQGKFLHVQIASSLPAMAQANIVQVPQNQAQVLNTTGSTNNGTSSKKSSEMTDETQSEQSGASNPMPSSTKKSSGNVNIKLETSSNNSMNDLSNKYAIINNGKGVRCLICNREFAQKGNFKTHAMTHVGPTERPYDCETCGKRFTQKGNRDIHVKIHTGTKDHTCPYCERGFTQRGNLKTHIRSVHTGEKPFPCGECGKAFSQKANMLTHYRTHDKNSRFSCNLCGKTFSQKVSFTHNHFASNQRTQ